VNGKDKTKNEFHFHLKEKEDNRFQVVYLPIGYKDFTFIIAQKKSYSS